MYLSGLHESRGALGMRSQRQRTIYSRYNSLSVGGGHARQVVQCTCCVLYDDMHWLDLQIIMQCLLLVQIHHRASLY